MLRATRILTALIVPLVVAGTAQTQAPPKNPAPPSSQSMSQSMKDWPTEVDGKRLNEWVKDLEAKDPGLREMAVREIPYFGPKAIVYLPKIIEKLTNDVDYNVRFAALLVLSHNHIDDEKQRAEIVKKLIGSGGLLRSPQIPMRTQVALALMTYGRDAREAIDMLVSESYLKYASAFELRQASAAALGQIGRGDPNPKNPQQAGPDMRAVRALVNQLTDPSIAVRRDIGQAIMWLGRPARDEDWLAEKSKLIERINAEPDAVLKYWLRACIIRLDPTEWPYVKRDMASGLLSDKQENRLAAAEAIGRLAPQSKDLVDALLKSVNSIDKSSKPDDVDFLAICIWALGNTGTDRKKDVLPVLQKIGATHQEDKKVKEAVEYSIKALNDNK